MIIGTKLSTDMFFYDKERNSFSQEASSLNHANLTGRLYDDACDQGFVLVSARTGKELPFALTSTEIVDGEVVAWKFHSQVRYPSRKNFYVTVWND